GVRLAVSVAEAILRRLAVPDIPGRRDLRDRGPVTAPAFLLQTEDRAAVCAGALVADEGLGVRAPDDDRDERPADRPTPDVDGPRGDEQRLVRAHAVPDRADPKAA